MNNLIRIAFMIAAGTIVYSRLIHELPQWLAIILYNTSIILFTLGMYKTRKKKD